jgi:deoxyribonuclease-4
MPLLGAHQSIAGGYDKAVEIGAQTGCQVIQIFTKNTNQWRGKPIAPQEVQAFRTALAASGIACPLAHDSYLINLASPEDTLWKKSIAAMIDELERAAILGIPWVVSHPGAYTTSSEAEGLKRIVVALDEVLGQTQGRRRTPCAVHQQVHESKSAKTVDGTRRAPPALTGILLETTAGQGTTLGWRFEHLTAILAGVKDNRRLGVCFDTCHVFAAGYRISTRSDYRATMKEFDNVVGLDQIRAFHLNDSLKDCGSRVDRHAHVGRGKIGPEAFGWLLRDRRFRNVPMVLETPKGKENGEECDIINLRKLRELAETSRSDAPRGNALDGRSAAP